MQDTMAFGGAGLDRADQLRNSPEEIARLRADPGALMIALDDLIPVIEGRRVARVPLNGLPDTAELIFLGLEKGAPLFAHLPDDAAAPPGGANRNIWAMLTQLIPPDLAIYGGARSLLDWHARHPCCARCGATTKLSRGGWQRDCPTCHAQHFPRTDPVAIMLVEYEDRVLLGRQARFPAGSYSCLAGFVEPGETLEEAVAREVFEEAGVRVRYVRYVASQPWPFPSQLMLGCHAIANSPEIVIDVHELEDARWFTRAEVTQAMIGRSAAASFTPPPRFAIAYALLTWWLERGA